MRFGGRQPNMHTHTHTHYSVRLSLFVWVTVKGFCCKGKKWCQPTSTELDSLHCRSLRRNWRFLRRPTWTEEKSGAARQHLAATVNVERRIKAWDFQTLAKDTRNNQGWPQCFLLIWHHMNSEKSLWSVADSSKISPPTKNNSWPQMLRWRTVSFHLLDGLLITWTAWWEGG